MKNIALVGIIIVLFLYIIPADDREDLPLIDQASGFIQNVADDLLGDTLDNAIDQATDTVKESIKQEVKKQTQEAFDSVEQQAIEQIDSI